MRPPLLFRSLAVLACSVSAAHAQSASPGAGFVTIALPATSTATRTDYFTPPLLPNAAFAGAVTAVTDGTLTVATASWTAGQWAGATPYHVYLKGGAQAGRVLKITANTATSLTVDLTDESAQSTSLVLSGFAVAAGDAIEIVRGYTLGSFFGATPATQVLTGGTSAAAADTVSLWNWKLKRFDSYYFNTASSAWLPGAGGASANDLPIPPGSLVAVTRPANRAAVQFVQLGRVPQVAPLIKEGAAGFTRYSSLRVPVDMALSQVALGSNWTKSNSAFTADTLSVFNQTTGTWDAYYQRSDGTWRKSGSTDVQDATIIPSGASVVLMKRASVTGKNSFLSVALPYTP